ncbi:MAG TPA: EamA family transporter [Acidobacteriaceae bacterium]|jgi:drug/metabolite transporter (DMT)-like permease|nr:EamA family transporter [Acidobacteriaceae bacterium]
MSIPGASLPSALSANILLALAAAASWGGGDFSGGMGVKAAGSSTAGALRVVLIAHASSLAVLLAILFAQHAPFPHGAPLAWGLLAGVTAGISLTAFYVALARGAMGAPAAVSGLLAAAIPAAVSSVLEGVPAPLRLAGFALALAAIWLIAAGPSPESTQAIDGSAPMTSSRTTMALAIVGGIGFGIYFVALRLANPLGVMEPVALARFASLSTCALLLLAVMLRTRRTHSTNPGAPSSARVGGRLTRAAILFALGVALLDTGGNLLFLAATRAGRLDIAAVLASLYPAGTILLAAWHLHERPTRRQLTGMAIAAAAVVMITL